MSIALDQIRQLPVGQRIQLVEDIWNTLVDEDTSFDLSREQLEELDQRHAELLKDPISAIPWSEARRQLMAGD
tara:strand:- start:428 stop:646 length:219 start_codon:yes stop_codon:yes gene_type:complete